MERKGMFAAFADDDEEHTTASTTVIKAAPKKANQAKQAPKEGAPAKIVKQPNTDNAEFDGVVGPETSGRGGRGGRGGFRGSRGGDRGGDRGGRGGF